MNKTSPLSRLVRRFCGAVYWRLVERELSGSTLEWHVEGPTHCFVVRAVPKLNEQGHAVR